MSRGEYWDDHDHDDDYDDKDGRLGTIVMSVAIALIILGYYGVKALVEWFQR